MVKALKIPYSRSPSPLGAPYENGVNWSRSFKKLHTYIVVGH